MEIQLIEVTTSKMLVGLEKGQIMEYDLEFLNDSFLKKESLQIISEYLNAQRIERIIDSFGVKDEQMYSLSCKVKEYINKIKEHFCDEYGDEDWCELAHTSVRTMEIEARRILIHEATSHVVNNDLIFNFVTHVGFLNPREHYTQRWPAQLWIKNYFVVPEKRRDNPIRIKWINIETNKPMFGCSAKTLAREGMLFFNYNYIYYLATKDFEFKREDVLPILEWYKRDRYSTYEDAMNWDTVYPHKIKLSDVYWIGKETSLKRILNKAYRNPHGITKNAFGGLNGIQEIGEFQILRDAITAVRILRGFSPQTLEKISPWALYYLRAYSNTLIKEFEYFFKLFGYKEHYIENLFYDNILFQQKISWEMFPDYFNEKENTEYIQRSNFVYGHYDDVWIRRSYKEEETDEVLLRYSRLCESVKNDLLQMEMHIIHGIESISDTVNMMKQIHSSRIRRAIIDHVNRNRMSFSQVHDFILAEFNKIKQQNIKLKLNDTSKSLKQYDNKEIAPGITFVMPKMSHDLIEWGTTQNNCIGSYSNRVNDGHSIIVGFKNCEGEWIGHAEIDPKDLVLRQLLGKHNAELPAKEKEEIVIFLKKSNIDCSNFWGS